MFERLNVETLKRNPLRPLGREGTPVVPPRLTPVRNKNPCVMQQGGKASVTLFRYAAHVRLYPCSITGAPELGYLLRQGDPAPTHVFALSTRRSIRLLRFCLAPTIMVFRPILPGSLEIALKRTRPRQRFYYLVGRDCMTEAGRCQEGELCLKRGYDPSTRSINAYSPR